MPPQIEYASMAAQTIWKDMRETLSPWDAGKDATLSLRTQDNYCTWALEMRAENYSACAIITREEILGVSNIWDFMRARVGDMLARLNAEVGYDNVRRRVAEPRRYVDGVMSTVPRLTLDGVTITEVDPSTLNKSELLEVIRGMQQQIAEKERLKDFSAGWTFGSAEKPAPEVPLMDVAGNARLIREE